MTWKKAVKDYTAKVLATSSASLVGYWPLDDAIGSTTARNLKVGANTIGSVNGTGYAFATGGLSGPTANYLTMAGTQAAVTGTIASWDGATGTLMAWVRPTTLTGTQSFFGAYIDANNYTYLQIDSSAGANARNVSTSTAIGSGITAGVQANIWMHVACNITSTTLTVYLNGVKAASPTARAAAFTGSATTGRISFGGSAPTGSIAHCAIWTGANLTDDQILQLSRLN